MSTYFGYVEREADSYVNWAEVGRNLVTTINDIDRVRQEKKDALDEASRAYANELQKAPQGEHRDANKWTMNFADDASQYMLMQDRLLKSGQMKVKDYMVARQNLIDGTDRAFTMMKKYQESYKTMMDSYRKGELSQATIDNFGFLERFGDFNKSSLYINPNDGSVSVGLVTEEVMPDGKKVRTMSKNPNDFANISVLDGILNTKIDRFDSNKVATDLVNTVKPDVLTMYKSGLKVTEKGVYNLKGRLIISDPFENISSTAEALDNLNRDVLNTITIYDEITKKDVGAAGNIPKVAKEFQRIKALKDAGKTVEEKDNKLYESVRSALAGMAQASEEERAMALNFKESEDAIIRAAMPTPYHEQSVLVDNMKFYGNPADNVQYSYTWDANEAKKDPSKILKVVESNTVTYKLSPEQKAAAEDYMRKQMRVRYAKEYTEEVTSAYTKEQDLIPTKKPSNWDNMSDGDKKKWSQDQKDREAAMHFMNLYNGTEREIEIAKNFFEKSPNVVENGVKRTLSGISITYKVPGGRTETKKIPFFTKSNKKALNTLGFFEAGYNILNEALPEDTKIQSYDIARNYVASSNKNTLMPNMRTFYGDNYLGDFTNEELGIDFRIPGYGNINAPLDSYIQKLNQLNQQGGGSAAGGSSAGKGSGAAAAGGKAR